MQNGTYGVIDELYQGNNCNFTKCLSCNYQSQRQEKFYDLQLPVKNEFEGINNGSIEEAL